MYIRYMVLIYWTAEQVSLTLPEEYATDKGGHWTLCISMKSESEEGLDTRQTLL